jgi:hypothetical protein
MAYKRPVGWRNEPGRHALAARGVKTGRKNQRNGYRRPVERRVEPTVPPRKITRVIKGWEAARTAPKVGSNQEAADLFADRMAGRSNKVYSSGDAIYSYGSHFPMAVWGDGDVLYVNSDRYSVTTSQHQGLIWRARSKASREVMMDTRELKDLIYDHEEY